MKQLLTHNLGWKLLSLVIAVALWIAVAREPELDTSLSVPIEFKNIPEDLDIGSDVPERIHLEVRGPSGRLSRDNLANVALVLDLSDARAGERTYTVHPREINLPAGVAFYRAVPSQLTLRFDRLVVRDVRVTPLYVKIPEGYQVSGAVLDPERVRLRGPEEHMKAIARVQTDPIDLSGVISQAELQTHVHLGDSQVRVEEPAAIRLKVILHKTAPSPPITPKDSK